MIVGVVEVDTTELVKHDKTAESFIEYAKSLVPEPLRHVKAIVDNQCYLCCLHYRKTDVPWDKKKLLINAVMPRISVTGYADSLIPAGRLLDLANGERMLMLKEAYESVGKRTNGRMYEDAGTC